jgi:ADP-heptose:LPS heptosyltransferase
MSRTLIVYLHGIGDNIMLSGVLKEYCQRHPDKIIDLVVLNPGCATVWRNNPHIDSLTVYPQPQPHFWNPALFYLSHRRRVVRWIREFNADGRYERVLFPQIQTIPEIFYHVTASYGRHKVDRICAELGLPAELHPYDLYPTATDAVKAEDILKKHSGQRLAVLHPFSGHAIKRLSRRGFGDILKALRRRGFATLVVGSAAEAERMDPEWPTTAIFGLEFGVLIEVMKRASVFAGTDSAVAHLAAFANTPDVVIFSPKLEPSRYLPISHQSRLHVIRIRQGRESAALTEFHRVLERC